jgi:hypothetical protein
MVKEDTVILAVSILLSHLDSIVFDKDFHLQSELWMQGVPQNHLAIVSLAFLHVRVSVEDAVPTMQRDRSSIAGW